MLYLSKQGILHIESWKSGSKLSPQVSSRLQSLQSWSRYNLAAFHSHLFRWCKYACVKITRWACFCLFSEPVCSFFSYCLFEQACAIQSRTWPQIDGLVLVLSRFFCSSSLSDAVTYTECNVNERYRQTVWQSQNISVCKMFTRAFLCERALLSARSLHRTLVKEQKRECLHSTKIYFSCVIISIILETVFNLHFMVQGYTQANFKDSFTCTVRPVGEFRRGFDAFLDYMRIALGLAKL